ncbi:Thymidylate kinase [Planctomycetes bacterium Pla163]|uniref:Thymidylate kinase n=1 Tax=Rohdeia mirabilis TaxID=2528008 RepID=A0A518D0C3_9BACT|nr:Thymidylate kinase [Planctomycetes bacterium Pla163]
MSTDATSTVPETGRGLFVVLDGVDGCGKSTQAERLARVLEEEGPGGCVHVREPGTTALGEALRALLLDGREDLDAGTEALLFAAARRHLLVSEIEPALAAGKDVVCERFHASTYAYQGVAGGLGAATVLDLLGTFADRPAPDLELVLDLDPASAGERRGADSDRIEAKGLDFQRRVAAAYREYTAEPGRTRAHSIDARGSEDEVHARVLAAVHAVRGGARSGTASRNSED